ncbi:MAG: hypothetical protein NXI10_11795 [bacterium]|nr:hypothetical protein [bacterium]
MKLILATIACSVVLFSCKEEGCTDPFAINYSADAEKDDGSCVLEGRVLVWFNAATATDLVNASIPNVDIVINGVMEGSIGMTESSVTEPACGDGEGFLAYIDMSDTYTQTMPYVIYKGGTTEIVQSGNVGVKANQCEHIELTY